MLVGKGGGGFRGGSLSWLRLKGVLWGVWGGGSGHYRGVVGEGDFWGGALCLGEVREERGIWQLVGLGVGG